MQYRLVKKGIILGIIVLFIGLSVASSADSSFRDQQNKFECKMQEFKSIDEPPEEKWNKIYDVFGNDSGISVKQTSDNGYIIAGVNDQYIGKVMFWLIKTSINGI